MLIQVLKSKLKEVIVTDANIEYEGSLTLDPLLMKAAELHPYERVEVNAVNGKSRIVTYVIAGKRGSGCVELNGGAANFFNKGDKVHVNCFAFFGNYDGYYKDWKDTPHILPKIVITDENNKVID